MRNVLEKVQSTVRSAVAAIEEISKGGMPAATPPPGDAAGRFADFDRETSTNAQAEGAADEPWGGNR